MAQHTRSPQVVPADFADRVILFPTRFPAPLRFEVPTALPSRPATGPVTGRQRRTRTRAIRQVAVIEVAGPLSECVEELDRAIQLALAEGPRGVVCDLSNVFEGVSPAAITVLATAGRHVRDWPGTPVGVACPDPRVRKYLRAHPLGGHLILTASLFSAVSEVLASPAVAVERLHLTAHPTAPRASRDFVTRTLLDWRLGQVIPFATLAISELVTRSMVHAGTDIDLTLAWNLGALRLTVRDRGPALQDQVSSAVDLSGPGLTVVASLSRTIGSMPASAGGQVVWAVLEATRPRSSTRRIRSQPASATPNSPVFTDSLGLAGLPFCAGSSGAQIRTQSATPS